MRNGSGSIISKLTEGACYAQRMSDDSGETYRIEVAITALIVHGEYASFKHSERVGFNELMDTGENLLISAVDLLRATIRCDANG